MTLGDTPTTVAISAAAPSQPAPPPGLRIDLAGWTRDATRGSAHDFFALFETAEQLGFDGVWFSEFRLASPDWPYPSPLLLAAALLARTERLRIGTAVLVLPLHKPQLLAEELQQLAFQSGGRLDVGLGRGTDPATLNALGIRPEDTRPLFEKACDTLLAGPHPPLYIGGTTAESIDFAVQRDLPLLLSLEPPEARQLTLLDAAAGAAAPGLRARSSLARYVCIAPTRAEALAQLEQLWPRLHERRVYFAAKRGVPSHEVQPIDTSRMLREQFVWGEAEQCLAQLKVLLEHTGIQALRCVFNANGLLDNTTALAHMRLFAREVLPVLRTQLA
ncbi:LLM class flavin-dependent oxidoreductase [Hydrogenophaga palleronii]|uniref:LLM class flavin-dependent oxidoreductase n=1 Tax=Hydrogenophaga palleronii TaxID=65655 RepID=UPI000A91C882|nr:LLM class flavin-dependent oxidoreductase [Hydrogenophaga palleronii]